MKQGVTKQEFIESLEHTLQLTREGVVALELKDNDTVIIHYKGGYKRDVNIAMDSAMAIIRDVAGRV